MPPPILAPTMERVNRDKDVATAPRRPTGAQATSPRAGPSPPERRLLTAARFGTVGAAGAVVNTVGLHVLYALAHVPLALASALATELAIGHNYLLNDRWTFRRRHPTWSRLLRFNVAALGGLATNVMLLWSLVHLGVGYVAANLLGIAAAATVNYAVSVVWVWREGAT